MNKKVLAIPIVLMTVAMLVVPVMAKPTEELKVPASLIAGPQAGGAPPEKQWTTNGGIWQARSQQVDYSPIGLTIGSDSYTDGYSRNFVNSVLNLKTKILNTRGLAVWTFKDIDGKDIGGFEGNLEMKLSVIDGYYSVHGVLFGFGNFEGQTLMLSYEGPPAGAVWTGYCLKA
jgi:hypothetical protein